MKSNFKTILIAAAAVFCFTACNRCVTCTYTNHLEEEVETDKTCGSKKDREAFESDLNDQWGDYGEVSCAK